MKKITAHQLYGRYLVPYVKLEQQSGIQKVDVRSAIEHARDCAFQDGYTEVPDGEGLYTNIYTRASMALLQGMGVGRHDGALILERH